MSIFIDSGAFIAYYNKKDEFHELSKQLFKQIEDDDFGYAATSDYVLDEVTTRIFMQLGKENAVEVGKKMMSNYPIIQVDRELFQDAWNKFSKLKPFNLTDCTNLAIIESHKLDYIFTFDGDFKNFVKTIGAL